MSLPTSRHSHTQYSNGYSNGYSGGYKNGHASYYKDESWAMSPQDSKYHPKFRKSAYARRRLFLKLGFIFLVAFGFSLLVSPSLRFTVFSAIGLGYSLYKDIPGVEYHDLSLYKGSATGWQRGERILFLSPLRDAEAHLPMFFSHLRNLTYPHHLIDLAFLVSDSKDNTMNLLTDLLKKQQSDADHNQWFGEITVIEKDFGAAIGQDFSNRHGFAAQGPRRKLMARARNWLLNATLKPHHSWVYWRDADVETAPTSILEDLMRHNKDVIVPNVWRPLPDWLGNEQPYDLNSWQESETGLELAAKLGEDDVIVEGYAEYATWRPHLAYLRDPRGDPDVEMELDGVGGVSILAKALVFRAGAHFPAFSFEKHAETEGFGKMCRRMKFSVIGLPHYTIWHLYEPSSDDLKHMKEMEEQRIAHEKEEKEKAEQKTRLEEGWDIKKDKDTWDKDQKEIIDAALKAKEVEKGAMASKGTGKDSGKTPDQDLRGSREGPIAHVDEPGVGVLTTEDEEKKGQIVVSTI
ncbi:Mannan polymerase II complex anp1 subunit, variant 3 [Orbilia oligospora]|uniref:Mannan polymerase II complex anp1 subunit, variant 2 n=1 Tax=Orbilia oligospora TaxID=2813651 RepID=A0A7C8NWT7_ORBOL|nr:Mannan polymerase II complex anp1 subunit, variant 2 [Orbilia oligospora]KAF3195190.1 Mannan polymerase II complex anp1 subunit, variant 3 [Orbilia oligospora]KAF3262011.1 Mannan polymerase II complex anp1 subunit, variant 3 [Orbilia oligospora]KAF3266715.1 Mannan polymerase II complex anp1 subunit, variant 2 [Orbilia oligospora]